MRFVKMHGAANDYVFVDGFRDPLPDDPEVTSRLVSDRHRGIGADGLILVEPSSTADARMRIFNADGSEAEMCGNGLRCAAKLLYDERHVESDRMTIATGNGPLRVECHVVNGLVESATIDMGEPVLDPARVPVRLPGPRAVAVPVAVAGKTIDVTAVSTGNPHAVVFVEEPTDDWVLRIGPRLERHPLFPNRTNVEFVRVDGRNRLSVRVWERGSGETLACGTGACAAVVAARLANLVDDVVQVSLPGGDLTVEWPGHGGIRLTGPAVEVFRGVWRPSAAVGRDRRAA